MRMILPTLASGLLILTQASQAQDASMGQMLQRSAVVEWVFSNCSADDLDAGYLMAAQAMLEGSPEPLAEMARAFVRDGAESRYENQAEACADMRSAVPDTPPQ